jgi:hypothetical protein
VLGYHVYRAETADGPFTRLTDSPISGTSYTDSAPISFDAPIYMVRALALQTNPSGSYLNPSEGIFIQVNMNGSRVPVLVSAALTRSGIALSWSSQTNAIYHVEAKSLLAGDGWTNISGPISAIASLTTFVDTNSVSSQARLYRVVSQ